MDRRVMKKGPNHSALIRWGLSLWFVGLQCWGQGHFVEVKRFTSRDAHQGVGVGPQRVYAIGSRSITAHDKLTGAFLTQWKSEKAGDWIHLDSGLVREGKLYCAHSNFPLLPMTGSVEVYDAITLEWQSRHVFEKPPGSCTWVDWYEGKWWVCFAHYNGFGGDPRIDHSATTLVRYSKDWLEEKRWAFPQTVLSRFGSYSCSGGSWGADGLLYCTGHDAAEVYKLRVSDIEEELELVEVQALACFGQGIAWDRSWSETPALYSIKRRSREVVSSVWNDD